MNDENILAGKKILFVEDDVFFSNMISTKLAGFKCTLTSAMSGKETFSALEKEKPDVILLDLLLPGGMDGFAILEKIKADPNFKDIPVIILSNLNRVEDIERGIKLGAFLYLTKALVSPTEIIENVKSVMGLKRHIT